MRISWKWLSELVDLSQVGGPDGLAALMTSRGLEVESVEKQNRGLEKVITAQILERAPHPQSDRLSLCKVTIGNGDPLEIVCGAQNMKSGDKVALAQIGADLPNGVKIGQSKIRGVVSNGMLCSEDELKLSAPGTHSEGIMILPTDTKLGVPLAELLGRDDAILVFKLTANRGDCMSHYGMAREVAAALGLRARRTNDKVVDLSFGEGQTLPIAIRLEAGEDGPQFFGCLIEGIRVGPSPQWLVSRLEALGQRSINNVVDASNLVLLEIGQPTHAYDADLIQGKELKIRRAREGEELPLLDGQTVKLSGSELVIGDAARAVGLAGVMGGGNSEVRPETQRVFLEAAEFSPGLVRRAASKHQRRTDAAQRFEKGIDPMGLPYAMSRLASLIVSLAGGKVVASGSVQHASRVGAGYKRPEILVKPEYFAKFLGLESGSLSSQQASDILNRLDCEVSEVGSEWKVVPPSYRRDLRIPEDLAEEIARTIGYDKIPSTIPPLSSDPSFGASHRARLSLVDRAKDVCVAAGLNETLNFAFTSKAWLAKFGFKDPIIVLNPISEEHEAMVPSLLPGLIRNALDNWSHHFGSESLPIRLFELRPVFSTPHGQSGVKASGEMDTGVVERWKLAFAISGPRYSQGLRNEQGEVDFYDLKAIVEGLCDALGTKGVRIQPLSASRTGGHPLLHPGQSVEILAGKDVAGHYGLLHPAQARDLKTRAALWVGELDFDALAALSRSASESKTYKAPPQFPSMERDFALVVRSEITADKITGLALKAGKPLAKVAKVFDIYRGSQVAEGMTSVAVRVIFYEDTRSLQESEVEAASQQILSSWKKDLGAELRS